MTRVLTLALGFLLAAQVVAQGQPESAKPTAEANDQAPKADPPDQKSAEQSANDDPPEAGAAAAAKAQQKTPEQLAKEKAKKEFEETVARF